MQERPTARIDLPPVVTMVSHVERWSVYVLAAVGAIALLGNVIVAVAHLYDRYHVSHVSGVWMALVDAKTFYPPLFEEGFYGGTRYWPLSILWNEVFASLSGDLIAGTKLAGAVSMLAVAAMMYVIIRDRGAPRAVAFGFATVGFATEVSFMAFTSPFRGDATPVALTLAALYVATRPTRTVRHVVIAGVLCGLAVIFKVTAVPAAAAIGLVLLWQDRRQLGIFVATWVVVVLVTYGGFHVVTDGRMTENLRAISASALDFGRLLGSPGRLLYVLLDVARVVWVGMLMCGVAIASSLGKRTVTIYQLTWAGSLAVILFLLIDPGISYNHCIELLALTFICVADYWVEHPSVRGLVALLVAWTALGDFDRTVSDDLRNARRTQPEHARDPLEGLVPADAKLLSEDVGLPVLRGQRPVVLDPWTLPRTRGKMEEQYQALIGRIAAKEFDRIVLLVDPESEKAKHWYQEQFGLEIIDAIRAHYGPAGSRYGYHVLKPRL